VPARAVRAARGASPPAPRALAGCPVGAGRLLVRGVPRPGAARATGLALAVGACIAGYTLVDKHGIRHAGPIPYLELVVIPVAVAYAGTVALTRGLPALRAQIRPAPIAAGVATFGAYVLVLAALRLAAAAPVAAVRETSVVIATALAAVVLRERVGPLRMLGAVAVAGGVALVAV